MIWGATLRSPHPYARITSHRHRPRRWPPPACTPCSPTTTCPAPNRYGLEHADQPVLAEDVVRYQGEPVALVAADHPEIARRRGQEIVVDYEVLDAGHRRRGGPARRTRRRCTRSGNLVRHLKIRKGDARTPRRRRVVTGSYRVGMQDQAFLGPEAGLAVPDGDGGVDLYVATQWLHVDQRQICAALGLPPEQVRLTLAGVGGAFGGREDLSMHVHACLLALHTGKPVKMVYNREESFFGHVHRHPATMRYEHGATRDGQPRLREGRDLPRRRRVRVQHPGRGRQRRHDGHRPVRGAERARRRLRRLHQQPAVRRDARLRRRCRPRSPTRRRWTSWPTALGLDPVELRCRNAHGAWAARRPTGQIVDSPAPVAELLRPCVPGRMPPRRRRPATDLRELPGGVANTTHGEGVRRGVGYAVAYKNVGFSEGFDDYSTARVRLETVGGEPLVTVHTAAAEVGQGLVTVEQQICRTELGVEQVVELPQGHRRRLRRLHLGVAADLRHRRRGQGGLPGRPRARCFAWPRPGSGAPIADLRLERRHVVSAVAGKLVAGWPSCSATRCSRRPCSGGTGPPSRSTRETGQGFAHVQYAFAAHRAVVDVDTELGLVKVVELACAQDVGKAINPRRRARPDPRRQRPGPRPGRHGGDPGHATG